MYVCTRAYKYVISYPGVQGEEEPNVCLGTRLTIMSMWCMSASVNL